MLRLIHLGRQKGGLRVVRSVALDRACDEISQIIALRALVTLGSSRDRARLARHLKLHHRDLPRTYVLQALDSLLLDPLSIRDFFHILDAVGVKDEGGIGSPLLAAQRALPLFTRAY